MVMIGTPTYDGKVDCRYLDALLGTVRLAAGAGVVVAPVYIPGCALIQRARNSLVKIAVESSASDLVFIDADISWKPEDFMRLISHDLEVVGGVYRQKSEDVVLVYRPKAGATADENGVLEVVATGCGFLRIRIDVLKRLWAKAKPYKDGPVECRNLFEIQLDRGELISEDIVVCRKWRAMRGAVYLDTRIAVDHVGTKVYEVEKQKPVVVEAKK